MKISTAMKKGVICWTTVIPWPSTNKSSHVSNFLPNVSSTLPRARNKGRSTDNVRTDCGFDRSNFRLAGHVDRSKFSRIENEINLRFLQISCFSCYLSSRCVLQNFDMKSWWHATGAVVYNSRIETLGFAHFQSQNYQIFPTFWVYGPLKG